jgi:dTDP-4-dehydrorhamnose reductase
MKILIIGAGGRLGAALMREYRDKFEVVGFGRAQLDLGDFDRVREKLSALDFNVLINTAAFTNVDRCEKEIDQAFRINAAAPELLAQICRDKKAKLIHFSTDYVFDGEKREPYAENDVAKPISVYGESKREGEKSVLQTQDRHLVVRVSWVFGPDRPSFVDAVIKGARESDHVDAVADKFSTPTYTRDIAKMLPQFFDVDASRTGISEAGGVLHFANAGECSWQEYAQFALDSCHSLGIPLKARTVSALKLADMKNWIARRPVYSVLSTEKFFSLTGTTPRNWRDAVADYVREFVAR